MSHIAYNFPVWEGLIVSGVACACACPFPVTICYSFDKRSGSMKASTIVQTLGAIC